MGLNFLKICSFFFIVGCSSNRGNVVDLPIPPPPPPPILFPKSPPPNFIPNIKDIQINSIPNPLNLNGHLPYVVWVDGKRLPLNSFEVKALAKSLNIPYKEPENTAKIHSGEGWLFPFPINSNSNNKDLNNKLFQALQSSE